MLGGGSISLGGGVVRATLLTIPAGHPTVASPVSVDPELGNLCPWISVLAESIIVSGAQQRIDDFDLTTTVVDATDASLCVTDHEDQSNKSFWCKV